MKKILAWAIMLGTLLAVPHAAWTQTPTYLNVRVTGPEETVFDYGRSACDVRDNIDAPARAFRDAQNQVQLIATNVENRRLVGPDLNHLSHQCEVIMPSHHDPHPAEFQDNEWLHSPYTLDGQTIYALVHEEYHGWEHGQCSSRAPEALQRCWMASIILAVSHDGGATYFHSQPPSQLVASLPVRYQPDAGVTGIFSPSNIIQKDGYYYALIRMDRYGMGTVGLSLMRTQDLANPGSWRAWDGQRFTISFVDPYRENDRGGEHVPALIQTDLVAVGNVTFNQYLNAYMIVGVAGSSQNRGKVTPGVYYALSKDLIHWSPRQLLMPAETANTYQCGGPKPILYPSIIDPESPTRNFETAGQHPYLYYARYNPQNCNLGPNRDIVRVPIEFSLHQ